MEGYLVNGFKIIIIRIIPLGFYSKLDKQYDILHGSQMKGDY